MKYKMSCITKKDTESNKSVSQLPLKILIRTPIPIRTKSKHKESIIIYVFLFSAKRSYININRVWNLNWNWIVLPFYCSDFVAKPTSCLFDSPPDNRQEKSNESAMLSIRSDRSPESTDKLAGPLRNERTTNVESARWTNVEKCRQREKNSNGQQQKRKQLSKVSMSVFIFHKTVYICLVILLCKHSV
jgi:hypothetical protein